MVERRFLDLLDLTRTVGDPANDMAILAEGNCSARADDETFFVKASGFSQHDPKPESLVRVRFDVILDAIDKDLSDDEVSDVLMKSIAGEGTRPSTETFMHAYLLTLPDVNFVSHCHPTVLLALLATEGARELCDVRLFPDEIVCCGPATAWVPYVDPGLILGKAVRASTEEFVDKHSMLPKIYYMENHGLIALGKTLDECKSATRMAVKAARAYLGILSSGRKISPLSPENVERIQTRPDEVYRQNLLWALGKK